MTSANASRYMVGFVLEGARLPQPGYGHIFVGGPAPALAYQIAANETRVMFDIPDNPHGVKALEKDPACREHACRSRLEAMCDTRWKRKPRWSRRIFR